MRVQQVDKSSPIQWLTRMARQGDPASHGFDVFNALALGDSPQGNDEPLTKYHAAWLKANAARGGAEQAEEEGGELRMPFISVEPLDSCGISDDNSGSRNGSSIGASSSGGSSVLDMRHLVVGRCEVGSAALLRGFSEHLRATKQTELGEGDMEGDGGEGVEGFFSQWRVQQVVVQALQSLNKESKPPFRTLL